MEGPLLFVVQYTILTAWIVAFVIRFRKRISAMAGMTSAMCLAMTIGLGTGALLAALFPGHFFQACVVSMLLAGLIGAAAGAPIGLMAVLDGLLSGIMGGMMGAMFMAMIPAAYFAPTLKLSGVWITAIIFILLLMLVGEVNGPGEPRGPRLLFSPQAMFIADLLFLAALIFIQPLPGHMDNRHRNHDHSMEQAVKSNYAKETVITATDFAFSPQQVTWKANEPVKLTLVNAGKAEHDIDIAGTAVHIHALPGSTDSDVIRIDKPGIYKAVCTLPGHHEAGMVLRVTVIP